MTGKDAWGLRAAVLALAVIAGAALQLQQAVLWPASAYLALLALGVAASALGALRVQPRGRFAAALLGALLVAFSSTGWRAGVRLADALPPALEGQDLVVTGVVAELPRQSPDGVRFTVDVQSAQHGALAVTVPARISLAWYRGWDGDALIAAPFEEVRAGQRWRLPVRLKAPHGSLNPHGFDVELWLFERGIRASGDVRARDGSSAVLLEANAGHPIERLRQRLRDAILVRVADPRAAGVIAALAVGDQAAIERSDWDLFRATGIAHLVSISGLHVTMFAWLAGGLIGVLWRRSERAMLALPAAIAARWGGVACAASYALLAGWGVPAQRTVWMLLTAALLAQAGLRWPWPLVLLAAATVVTAVDPWAVIEPGFWLSFVAVGVLLVAAPAPPLRASPRSRWQALGDSLRGALRTQTVVTLGLAPLSLVFFHQVSVVGFVANLVAIPLVTLLITPLALLGVLLPQLWQVAAWLVQGLAQALTLLAAWPGAVWTAAAAPLWAQAAGLLGGLLLIAPLPWRLRVLALPLLLPLLWPPLTRPADGQMQLLVADVGQGSAVLVRTRRHLLLHDAGPTYGRDSDAGSRVVLPLLRAQGSDRIDLLMLSHRDSDHVGGAAAVLAALPVAALSSSLEASHPLVGGSVPHTRCQTGQRWQWDGVGFAVLHPSAADYERAGVKPNALSCVLRVTDEQGRSVLLTGDIEAAQEKRLVQDDAAALASQVLLVPHHGSKTSSSAPFLDAVAPSVALVQAGYRNRFGHPAPPVLARYAERGIPVIRSDTCGAWQWQSNAAPSAAGCAREQQARYWHHRAGHDGVKVASP